MQYPYGTHWLLKLQFEPCIRTMGYIGAVRVSKLQITTGLSDFLSSLLGDIMLSDFQIADNNRTVSISSHFCPSGGHSTVSVPQQGVSVPNCRYWVLSDFQHLVFPPVVEH